MSSVGGVCLLNGIAHAMQVLTIIVGDDHLCSGEWGQVYTVQTLPDIPIINCDLLFSLSRLKFQDL